MLMHSLNYFRKNLSDPGKLLLFLLLTMILIACGKENSFDLFKSTGPIVREQRTVDGTFEKISLNNNINLVLTQGNLTTIEVEAGNNLLAEIKTEIKNNTLTIKNLNK